MAQTFLVVRFQAVELVGGQIVVHDVQEVVSGAVEGQVHAFGPFCGQ